MRPWRTLLSPKTPTNGDNIQLQSHQHVGTNGMRLPLSSPWTVHLQNCIQVRKSGVISGLLCPTLQHLLGALFVWIERKEWQSCFRHSFTGGKAELLSGENWPVEIWKDFIRSVKFFLSEAAPLKVWFTLSSRKPLNWVIKLQNKIVIMWNSSLKPSNFNSI